jgi:hypothetical protein
MIYSGYCKEKGAEVGASDLGGSDKGDYENVRGQKAESLRWQKDVKLEFKIWRQTVSVAAEAIRFVSEQNVICL